MHGNATGPAHRSRTGRQGRTTASGRRCPAPRREHDPAYERSADRRLAGPARPGHPRIPLPRTGPPGGAAATSLRNRPARDGAGGADSAQSPPVRPAPAAPVSAPPLTRGSLEAHGGGVHLAPACSSLPLATEQHESPLEAIPINHVAQSGAAAAVDPGKEELDSQAVSPTTAAVDGVGPRSESVSAVEKETPPVPPPKLDGGVGAVKAVDTPGRADVVLVVAEL